jgi:hypothetical protein
MDVVFMEHPIFSVSTKLSGYYEQNYLLIDIKPVTNGNATVHDCDILIVSISQLIFALNDNCNISQLLVHLKASDLLQPANLIASDWS